MIKISLKFVPNGSIDNIPALVQIMAWRQTGNEPLSETMLSYAVFITSRFTHFVNNFIS